MRLSDKAMNPCNELKTRLKSWCDWTLLAAEQKGFWRSMVKSRMKGGRNGFDGIESRWEGVPGSELP